MKNKNIAVVGGGVFGTTISWKLAEMGQKVDLFEKNKDIFMAASGINQYRIHRGYHYPRSLETVLTCIEGRKTIFYHLFRSCYRWHQKLLLYIKG